MSPESEHERAEALAREAVDRAVQLARENAEKATQLAVKQAVRDANVDRDLREHKAQLAAINGSQREMAVSLAKVNERLKDLVDNFNEQAAENRAVANYIRERSTTSVSRRTILLMAFGVLATYASLLAVLLGLGH